MEYIILSQKEPNLLIKEVNEMIRKGWELYGHLITERDWFDQAMVKED